MSCWFAGRLKILRLSKAKVLQCLSFSAQACFFNVDRYMCHSICMHADNRVFNALFIYTIEFPMKQRLLGQVSSLATSVYLQENVGRRQAISASKATATTWYGS